MRTVSSTAIRRETARLLVEVNRRLPPHVERAIRRAFRAEEAGPARRYLAAVLENLRTAGRTGVPICQDTGMATVFIEAGPGVRIAPAGRGTLEDVVNAAAREACRRGLLRSSVVDPLTRESTGENAPAVLHLLPAEPGVFRLTVLAKGFGSENTCALRMLKPSDGVAGAVAFAVETVVASGPNPCPPVFVGVGIGGTFEKAALESKLALCGAGEPGRRRTHAALEREIRDRINAAGAGPGGFGGRTTALAVGVRTYPTHIAGLPVAVSISCWAHRTGTVEL